MAVTLICCFHGRTKLVRRIIRFYLDQDFKGNSYLLLYNNSPYPQTLENMEMPENKRILLVNNDIDLKTGAPYTNVGDIFRDALTFVPPDTDICTFFDSDDCYLPNHISEGVKGMKEAVKEGKLAYKPYYSYYLYGKECELAHNNFEPSVFINFEYVLQAGFRSVACTYHQQWYDKLVINGGILDKLNGIPTLLYNWQEGHNTFKISGLGDHPDNFRRHREFERDFGDGFLYPADKSEVEYYYNLVKECSPTPG